MARSASVHSGYTIINGAGTGPNGDRIDVWIEYITTQDVINNRSRIIAYFYAALHPGESSATYGSNGCNSVFSVDGVSGINLKSNGSYDFRDADTLNLLGTFDGYVAHNDDGTKTVTLSGSFATPSDYITGGSASGNVTLPAIPRGFRVKVGGVWKVAVPYVKVGGTWKQAIAYGKVGTAWKQGI
jgi:hypothetical protein